MLLLHIFNVAVIISSFLSANVIVDGHKTPLTLCCQFDKVLIDGECENSFDTPGELPGIISSNDTDEQEEILTDNNVKLDTNDPCNYDWMTSWVTENYRVFKNGSIYAEELEGKSLSDSRYYCIFRNKYSANYSAKICRPWLANVFWDSFALIVAIIVLLAIFIGYTIVQELRNLHGLMLRSYLASYIFTYTFALVVVHTAEMINHSGLFTFSLFGMEYWGFSCVFWLNVMSFDIWRTVRCFRSLDSHDQVRRKKKYMWYAIYAWIVPAILISNYAAFMHYVPSLQNVIFRQIVRRYCRIGVKTSVFICNTFFYLSTALSIKRHQRDTGNLANGINKHHEANKQWVNLHVKLYLIMGGHMIPWIIWDYWPTPVTTSVLVSLEMVQSILIFVVFLWKDNIKRALRRRFSGRTYPQLYTVSTISYDTGITLS